MRSKSSFLIFTSVHVVANPLTQQNQQPTTFLPTPPSPLYICKNLKTVLCSVDYLKYQHFSIPVAKRYRTHLSIQLYNDYRKVRILIWKLEEGCILQSNSSGILQLLLKLDSIPTEGFSDQLPILR